MCVTKSNLTLDSITDKDTSGCNCGGTCGGSQKPARPLAIVKDATLEAADSVKATAETAIDKTKIKMRNENFQKGALVVISVAALYVILK